MALLAVSVLPNLSKETLPALSSVFFNTSTDCTQIGRNEKRSVLVPGSWYYIDDDGKRYPDQAQKERLRAAAKYWKEHQKTVEAIYLLDGVANDGSDFNTTYLIQIEPSIPRSIIIIDYKSFDTHTNMAEAKMMIPPNTEAVVISHPSHISRAVFDACVRGIKAIGVTVDTIQDSTTIYIEKFKLATTALLDSKGWFSTGYKSIVK